MNNDRAKTKYFMNNLKLLKTSYVFIELLTE